MKKTLAAAAIFAGLFAAQAYTTSPRHVAALRELRTATAHCRAEVRPNVLADVSAPPPAVRAPPPKPALRLVCGALTAMQRNPTGKRHVEYGNVIRCEWL